MFCMVRWVAGCERILSSGVPGKQKAKSQTDGRVNEGEGGGGVERAYHHVSSFQTGNKFSRHFLPMGYSKNKKTPPFLFPSPFKFCWCFIVS